MTLTGAGKSGDKEQRWEDEEADVTANGSVGEDLVVELQLSPDESDKQVQFILFRGDVPMPSERYQIQARGNVVQLTLKQSQKEDSGHYALVAKKLSSGLSIPGDERLESKHRIRLSIQDPSSIIEEGEPPIFLRRLSDLAVKVGTRTRFLVEIRSSTSPKVTWHKNDEPVQSGSRFSFVHEGNFYCVDVAPVMVDDQGHWTCMAENGSGRSSCTSFLSVIVPKAYKKPEFVEELKALLTETGTVSLECKVVGVPTPVLKWFKDQKEIKAGDVFALTANPEDPTSLGTYTCEAVNCMGTACSSSRVHVVGKGSREGSLKPADALTPSGPLPVFQQILRDESCRIGDTLVLSCQVHVPPWPKAIAWYNKEGKVEPSEKYHVLADGLGGYSIQIKGVEAMDEGEWKCVATSLENVKQFTTCHVAMSIPKNYRMPRFMESLKAVLTEEGLVSFECKVVGFPTPLLRWFKDGQELHPGDVYQLTGTNSLGSYCCIARNCMGEAKSIAELTVEDIQNQLNDEERMQLMSSNQAPKFVKGLRSCEARINEDFTFTIQVSVSPEPSLSWYRDDVAIIESEKYRLAREALGTCNLQVKKLEFMDQAEWKCVAANDFGHSVTSCFLKLVIPKHFKKPKFLESLRAILSEEGAVNLECKVIGVPQPILKWYKDGVELKPGDIHRIISGQDGTCCLGTYTCEATNCMGSVSSSASLLGFEDRVSVRKEEAKEPPTPLHELARNLSLSTIHEERTSQLYDTPQTDHSITMDDRGEVSFSFDGKEVSVSLYETPDLTEEEALQIVEMYADQLSEHITEGNIIELPPMRFTKETSTTGNLLMEAVVIDVSPDYFVPDEEGDDLRTEADVEDVSIMDDQMQSLRSSSFVSSPIVEEGSGERVPSGSPPSRPPRRKESRESFSSRSERSEKSLPKAFDWSESYHSAKEPSMQAQSSLQGQDDSVDAFTDALSSPAVGRSRADESREIYASFVEQNFKKLSFDETSAEISNKQDLNVQDAMATQIGETFVEEIPLKRKKKKKQSGNRASRTPSLSSKASSEDSYSLDVDEKARRRSSKGGKDRERRGSASSNKSAGKGRSSRSGSESGKFESAVSADVRRRESDATIMVDDVRIEQIEELAFIETGDDRVEPDYLKEDERPPTTYDPETPPLKSNKERLLESVYKLSEPIMSLRNNLVDLDALLPLLQPQENSAEAEKSRNELTERIVSPIENLCEQVSTIETKALKSAGDRSLAQNVRISLLEAIGGPTEELLRGIELIRRQSGCQDPKSNLIVLESLTDPVDEILVGLTKIEKDLTSGEGAESSLLQMEKPIALERMSRGVSRLGENVAGIVERKVFFGDESTSLSVIERLQSVYQSLEAFLSTIPLSESSGGLENNVDTLVIETLVRPLEELSRNLNSFGASSSAKQQEQEVILGDLEKSMIEMRTRLESLTLALETYERESGEQGITELHADLVKFLRYTMDDAVERLEKLKIKKKRVTQESTKRESMGVATGEEASAESTLESSEPEETNVLQELVRKSLAVMEMVSVPSMASAAAPTEHHLLARASTLDIIEEKSSTETEEIAAPSGEKGTESSEEVSVREKKVARVPELDTELSLPEMLLDPLIDVQANLSDVISDFESQESAEESPLPGSSELAACLSELRESVATAAHTATTLKSASTVDALVDLREPLLDLQLAMTSAVSPGEIKLIREATAPLAELKVIVAAAISSAQTSESSQLQMKSVLRMLEDIEAEVSKVESPQVVPEPVAQAPETEEIPKILPTRPPEVVEKAAIALTGVHFALSTVLERTTLCSEEIDEQASARSIAERSGRSHLISSIEQLRQNVGNLAVTVGSPVILKSNDDEYNFDIFFDELSKLEEPLLNLQKVLLTEQHDPEDRHVLNDVAAPIRNLKEVVQNATKEMGSGPAPVVLELIEDVEKDVTLIAMEALKKALAAKSESSDDDGRASISSCSKPGEIPGIISMWLDPVEDWLTATAEETTEIEDNSPSKSTIVPVIDGFKRELLKIAIQTSYSEPPSDAALIESLTELQEPLARVCAVLSDCHEPDSLEIVEGLVQPTRHLLGTILDASLIHEAARVLRPVMEAIEELENQIPLTIKRINYEKALQRVVRSMTPEEPKTLVAEDVPKICGETSGQAEITEQSRAQETASKSSQQSLTQVQGIESAVEEIVENISEDSVSSKNKIEPDEIAQSTQESVVRIEKTIGPSESPEKTAGTTRAAEAAEIVDELEIEERTSRASEISVSAEGREKRKELGKAENLQPGTVEVITVDNRPFSETITQLESAQAGKASSSETSRADQLDLWTLTLLGPLDRLGNAVLSLDRSIDELAHGLLCRPLDSLHKQIEIAESQFNRPVGQSLENDVETIIEGFLSPVNQLHSALGAAVRVWNDEQPRIVVRDLLRSIADSSTELCGLLDSLREKLTIQKAERTIQAQQEDASLVETINAVIAPLDDVRNLIEQALNSLAFADSSETAEDDDSAHERMKKLNLLAQKISEAELTEESLDLDTQALEEKAALVETTKVSVSQAETWSDSKSEEVLAAEELESVFEREDKLHQLEKAKESFETSVEGKAATSHIETIGPAKKSVKGKEESIDIEETTAKPLEELIEAIVDSSEAPRHASSSPEDYQSISPDVSEEFFSQRGEMEHGAEIAVQKDQAAALLAEENRSKGEIIAEAGIEGTAQHAVTEILSTAGSAAEMSESEGKLFKPAETSEENIREEVLERATKDELPLEKATLLLAENLATAEATKPKTLKLEASAISEETVLAQDLNELTSPRSSEESAQLSETESFVRAGATAAPELKIKTTNATSSQFEIAEESIQELSPESLQQQKAEVSHSEKLAAAEVAEKPDTKIKTTEVKTSQLEAESIDESLGEISVDKVAEETLRVREAESLAKAEVATAPDMKIQPGEAEFSELGVEESAEHLREEKLEEHRAELRENENLARAEISKVTETRLEETSQSAEILEEFAAGKLKQRTAELGETENLAKARIDAPAETLQAAQIGKSGTTEFTEEGLEEMTQEKSQLQEASVSVEELRHKAQVAKIEAAEVAKLSEEAVIEAGKSAIVEIIETPTQKIFKIKKEGAQSSESEMEEKIVVKSVEDVVAMEDQNIVEIVETSTEKVIKLKIPREGKDNVIEEVFEEIVVKKPREGWAKNLVEEEQLALSVSQAKVQEFAAASSSSVSLVETKEKKTEAAEGLVQEKPSKLDESGEQEKEQKLETEKIAKSEMDRQEIIEEREEKMKDEEAEEKLEKEKAEKLERMESERRESEQLELRQKEKEEAERVGKEKEEKLRKKQEVTRLEQEARERQEEQERARLQKEEEEEKSRKEEAERAEAERLRKDEAERMRREEQERLEKEEAEQIRKEEEERLERETAERLRKEEQERLEKEEAERKRKEEEEERHRKEEAERLEREEMERREQEAERLKQEELERLRKEEERLQKEEAERLEMEKLEREQREAERLKKEEEERLQKEEAERLEKEKQEAARLKQEELERAKKEEAERLEKEKQEAERLKREEAERLERERLEKEKQEAERLKQEELERAKKEEAERLEKEKREAERLKQEELERAEKEEAERLEQEKQEGERLKQEELERAKKEEEERRQQEEEAAKKEREKQEAEILKQEELERVKKEEADKLEREKQEAEKLKEEELERAKKEKAARLEREKQEAERLKQEELERAKKDEEERLAKEEAEKERKRQEEERRKKEEAERLEREKQEEERRKKEDAERLEREKQEAEKLKQEELERVRKAEEDRLKRQEEAEKLEQQERERARKEEEKRVEKEKAEKLAREQQEAEKLKQEELERAKQQEKERLEKEEAEKLENEKLERARKAEAERMKKEAEEKLEQERLEAERLKKEEMERVRKEEEQRQKEEAEKLEREKQEAERLKKEEVERARKDEEERLKKEEAEKLEKEKRRKEELERAKKAEEAKLEKEKLEKEKEEAERQKKEKAAELEKQKEAERQRKEQEAKLEEERFEQEKKEAAKLEEEKQLQRRRKEEESKLEAEKLEKEKERERLEKEKEEKQKKADEERRKLEESEQRDKKAKDEAEKLKIEELERQNKEATDLKTKEKKSQEEGSKLDTSEQKDQGPEATVETDEVSRRGSKKETTKDDAKGLKRKESTEGSRRGSKKEESTEDVKVPKKKDSEGGSRRGSKKEETSEGPRRSSKKKDSLDEGKRLKKKESQEGSRRGSKTADSKDDITGSKKKESPEEARRSSTKEDSQEDIKVLKKKASKDQFEDLEKVDSKEGSRRGSKKGDSLEETKKSKKEKSKEAVEESKSADSKDEVTESKKKELPEESRRSSTKEESQEDIKVLKKKASKDQFEDLKKGDSKEGSRRGSKKGDSSEEPKKSKKEKSKEDVGESKSADSKDDVTGLKKKESPEESRRRSTKEDSQEEIKVLKKKASKDQFEDLEKVDSKEGSRRGSRKADSSEEPKKSKKEKSKEDVGESKSADSKDDVTGLKKKESPEESQGNIKVLKKKASKDQFEDLEKVDSKEGSRRGSKKRDSLEDTKRLKKEKSKEDVEELKKADSREDEKGLRKQDSKEESKPRSKEELIDQKAPRSKVIPEDESLAKKDGDVKVVSGKQEEDDDEKTPMNSEQEMKVRKRQIRLEQEVALEEEPGSSSTIRTDSEMDSEYSESSKSALSRDQGLPPKTRRKRSAQQPDIETDNERTKDRLDRRETDRQLSARTRDETLSSDERHYTPHYSSTSRIHEFTPGPRDRGKKPSFCTKLTDRTAAEGSRIKLTCTVLGEPEPVIYWTKDGKELPSSSNRHCTIEEYGMVSLELYSALPKDSGEYSCVARNLHGQAYTEAKLKVYAGYEPLPSRPTFTRSIKDTYRSAENELVLECRVRGQPSPKITWLKDGQILEIGDRYQQSDLGDGICRLKISRPDFYDGGLYTCRAENASKISDCTSHVVNFDGKDQAAGWRGSFRNLTSSERDTGRPRFSSYLTDHSVPAGGTIALQVEVKGIPPPDITWMRGDKREPISAHKARTFADSGVYTLIVPEATESETGTYVCRASNAYGYVDTAANVEVVPSGSSEGGKPAMFVSRPAENLIYVTSGEDVSVSFRVNGVPKPRIVWMKGLRDITNGPKSYKESSDDYVRLTLKRATIEDEGTYCIMAKNRYGCDRTFYTVKVKQRARSLTPSHDWGSVDTDNLLTNIHDTERSYLKQVPGPITSEPVVIDGGRNWLALSWGKAVQHGPAPVVAYRVDAWLLGGEGGARWVELGITPVNAFDAFNLRPGGEYKFRITPRNRYGWGDAVTMTSSVTVREIVKFPEFTNILPGQLKALRGELLHLECEVRSESKAEVKWYRDTSDIDALQDPRYMTHYSGTKCTLTVQSIKENDSGRYVCEATNPAGRVSTFARVQVVTDPKIVEADEKLRRMRTVETSNEERPPEFTMRLRDRRVQMTYPVRLTCQVSGHPEPEVTWYRNREEIFPDDNVSFWDDESHFHTLEISHSNVEDSGIYMAKARNFNGSVSCRCHLVVDKGIRAYVAPEFLRHLDAVYTVKSGGELRLAAQIEAYPTVGIVWHRDGHRLRPSRSTVMTLNHDGSVELSLAHVTPRDAGLYCCTATNEVGQTESTTRVTVIGTTDEEISSISQSLPDVVESLDVPYSKEPLFVTKPLSTEAVEGDTVIILCEVVGDPKPEVIWLRDFLRPDYYRDAAHFRRVGAGPQYRLEIPYAKLDFTGAYTVIAKNCHGEAKAIISLQIYARGQGKSDSSMEHASIKHGKVQTLPSIKRPLRDLRCCDGDAVTLICRVYATPEPDVRWEKSGKLLPLGGDFVADFDGETARLSIQHVYPEDEGEYTCVAYNDLGKAFTSACLIVDVPEGKESALSRRLIRPVGLLSAESTPISTPRSTPIRSLSPACPSSRRELKPAVRPPRGQSMARRPRLPIGPKFYAVPHNRVAEEGETVRFQCAIAGHPTPWVTWDKDGIPVTPTTRITLKEKDDVRILEITEINHEDAGLYRITLENDVGRTEATARLEIIKGRQGSVPRTIRTRSASPRTYSIYSRSPVTLALRGDTHLRPNIHDSMSGRGGALSPTFSRWQQQHRNGKSPMESPEPIRRIKKQVRATRNNNGLADSVKHQISKVAIPPKPRSSSLPRQNPTGNPTNPVNLKPTTKNPARVETNGGNNRSIQNNSKKTTVTNGSLIPKRLPISRSRSPKIPLNPPPHNGVTEKIEQSQVSKENDAAPIQTDDKTIESLAPNNRSQIASEPEVPTSRQESTTTKNETESQNSRLIVNDDPEESRPPVIFAAPADTVALRGSKVILFATFDGEPQPKVRWLRKGRDVRLDDKAEIETSRGLTRLTLNSVTTEQTGKYAVTLENIAGRDCRYVNLTVEGVPDPPAGTPCVQSITRSGKAIVTWRSPSYDGGCAVTGYSVEMKRSEEPCWIAIAEARHSLSHTVTGLVPQDSYSFRVRAENAHGLSEPSAVSDLVTVPGENDQEIGGQVFTAEINQIEIEEEEDEFEPSFEARIVSPEDGIHFEERYDVKEELGKGRYGVVRRIVEKSTGLNLAAKFVRTIKAKDRQQVHEEIDIMNRLRHPKLLRLAAAFENPKEIIMVTEYISGGELFERVVADDFTLTEKDSILFVKQICEGVEYMHNNYVVHLDLKPENIMCHTRTSHRIKLIDFGLAQTLNPDTPVRVLFGTPEFIPPEIIGFEPIGTESDMWSVGVICYVLLTGLSPFMGDNDAETFANITRADYDFDDKAFAAISSEAKDFISALLIKRKELRMSAKQCLEHPWLAQQAECMSSVALPTDKLKKFIVRRKWQKTGNAIRALGRMAILSANSRRNHSAASSPTKTSFDDDLFSDVTANGMGFKPIKPVVIIEDRTVSDVFEKSSESADLEEDEREPEAADLPDHETTIDDDFSNVISIDDHLTVTEIDDLENCENNQIENDSPLIQEMDDFPKNDEPTSESCDTCIEEISSQVSIDENEIVTELHFGETTTSFFTENSRKQSFSSFVNLEISDTASADIDQENQLLQTRESEETSIREIQQYEQKKKLVDDPEIPPVHINLENLDANTETSPRTPVVTKVWCKTNIPSLVDEEDENARLMTHGGRTRPFVRTGSVSRTAKMFEKVEDSNNASLPKHHQNPINRIQPIVAEPRPQNERIRKAFAFWNK